MVSSTSRNRSKGEEETLAVGRKRARPHSGRQSKKQCPIQGKIETKGAIHPSTNSYCSPSKSAPKSHLPGEHHVVGSSAAAHCLLHTPSHHTLRPGKAAADVEGTNNSRPALEFPSNCPRQSRNSCGAVHRYCPDRNRVLVDGNPQGLLQWVGPRDDDGPFPDASSRTCTRGTRGQ